MDSSFDVQTAKKLSFSVESRSPLVTIAVERVTEEEFFSSSEESSEKDESSDSDPEWRKTPMFKRIVKERRSLAESSFKRKRGSDAEEYEKDTKPEKKKSGGSGSKEGCNCTTGCKTKRCSCKKS